MPRSILYLTTSGELVLRKMLAVQTMFGRCLPLLNMKKKYEDAIRDPDQEKG